jgi:hypothetical protein
MEHADAGDQLLKAKNRKLKEKKVANRQRYRGKNLQNDFQKSVTSYLAHVKFQNFIRRIFIKFGKI